MQNNLKKEIFCDHSVSSCQLVPENRCLCGFPGFSESLQPSPEDGRLPLAVFLCGCIISSLAGAFSSPLASLLYATS